jgi:hypothetical protein
VDGERRQFIRDAGLLLSVVVAGQAFTLSPREARAAALPWQQLNAAQAATLEALAELLVPGSKAAGVAQFVDKQLAAPPGERLLMLKYLGVEADAMVNFYTAALDSADALARRRHDQPWSMLSEAQGNALVSAMAAEAGEDWRGPPAGFFHFVLRADACDVTYGTEEGFDHLGLPYNAHIPPPPGHW